MKRDFNPSLKGPMIDLGLAAVVIAVAGIVWFSNTGTLQLAHAEDDLRAKKAANFEELEKARQSVEAARQELVTTREDRGSKAAYLDFLHRQINQKQTDLQAAWEAQRPNKEAALAIEQEIERLTHQRRAFKTDIMEAQWKIQDKQETISGLEAQLAGLEDKPSAEDQPLTTSLVND